MRRSTPWRTSVFARAGSAHRSARRRVRRWSKPADMAFVSSCGLPGGGNGTSRMRAASPVAYGTGLGPGAIVLLHDADVQSPPGSSRRATEALGPIAEDLHRQGLTALTLDELGRAPPVTVTAGLVPLRQVRCRARHPGRGLCRGAGALWGGEQDRRLHADARWRSRRPWATWVFRSLLSVTPVYDGFHFSQLRGNGLLGRLMDRAAVKVMLPKLIERG